MRARALLAAAACCAIAPVLTPAQARADEPSAAEPEPGDYRVLPPGHLTRVRFDPASRVSFGVSAAFTHTEAGSGVAPELRGGIWYRTYSEQGKGRDRVSLEVEHRVAEGFVEARAGSPAPPMNAALYGVSLLRHDGSPSLVLPASPPVAVPFPFDVGFDAEVGRVEVPDARPLVRVGVVRAELVLDPWRAGRRGNGLALGVGARYDLEAHGAPALSTPRLVHRVAPMTAASVRLHLESGDGRSALALRGDVVPHYASDGGFRFMALSSAHAERTLLAVADQPVAAVLDGTYRLVPPTLRAPCENEVQVSLGLRVSLTLR